MKLPLNLNVHGKIVLSYSRTGVEFRQLKNFAKYLQKDETLIKHNRWDNSDKHRYRTLLPDQADVARNAGVIGTSCSEEGGEKEGEACGV